jgi:hypothetical protein
MSCRASPSSGRTRATPGHSRTGCTRRGWRMEVVRHPARQLWR